MPVEFLENDTQLSYEDFIKGNKYIQYIAAISKNESSSVHNNDDNLTVKKNFLGMNSLTTATAARLFGMKRREKNVLSEVPTKKAKLNVSLSIKVGSHFKVRILHNKKLIYIIIEQCLNT